MKDKSVLKKVIAVLIAVCVLVGVFFCGYGVKSCAADYSLEWAISTIRKNYYEDISEEDLYDAYMHGEIDDVLDIYSAYYSKEEYASLVASNSGSKSGLGISYSYVSEGEYSGGSGILINYTLGNSPAKKAGIKSGMFLSGGSAGDTYVAVSERTEFTSSESFATFISGFSTGEKFTLYDADGSAYYTLSKEEYTASYSYMTTNSKSYDFVYTESDEGITLSLLETDISSGSAYAALPDGAAYIRLNQFYGNATQEISFLLEEFNALNCTSLILDLRGNGGGYVSVMQGIAGLFTSAIEDARGGIAMKAVYKDGTEEVQRMTAYPSSADYVLKKGTKVSILADDGSASASEALIGALISFKVVSYSDIYLSDYSSAAEYKSYYKKYYGEEPKSCSTYGKGIMQSTFVNVSTGEALKLTTAKIYWANGTCIHGTGITTADGCKSLSAAWDVDFGGVQLKSAIQAIYPGQDSSSSAL